MGQKTWTLTVLVLLPCLEAKAFEDEEPPALENPAFLAAQTTIGAGLDGSAGGFGGGLFLAGLQLGRLCGPTCQRWEFGLGLALGKRLVDGSEFRFQGGGVAQGWLFWGYRFRLGPRVFLPLRLRVGGHGFFGRADGRASFGADFERDGLDVSALFGLGPNLLIFLSDSVSLEVPLLDLTYVQSSRFFGVWASTGLRLNAHF